ncbi:Por secretion system C-terminal sorting domain-containing protein [Hyunsoonleella jejuensis]|uniref:Por secretion system C-terminal sorting domain-containing protein n=1 Tax=Hyunsoonleella jejuensis TaxID=419940 RepID=A0A1H9IVE2_9FLAO|nr:BNR-4 repeat-containing protein [Hyunsoonleella jejuensis]SEQ78506.1 Por secretion system C-terminal sorting domain-containing protein [Hyunsoonleella jejuensis]
MNKKFTLFNVYRIVTFGLLFFAFSNRMSAQVILENEIKITDFGLHFNGSKVASGASNTGDNAAYDYFFGRNISAHGDCIKTYGDYVFMTWYRGPKADRHVMLTRYNTKTGTMATIEFPHRHTGYQNRYWIGESHNTIAVGVSPLDGTIHLLYDMHAYSASRPSDGSLANDYFRYSYSLKNAASLPDADFTLDKFVQNGTGGYKHLRMPGTAANSEFLSLTYPRFFQNDGGDLFMLMREGGNNNGMYKFIKYDASTGDWGNFIDFNRLNAKSQPGIDYNWGLYGDMKYVNGKLRIGFQRRSANNEDKYQYQNGVYYAYSDDQSGATGWKNHKGEEFSVPLWDADVIKVMEPGDYVQTTQKDKVYIVSGFDWTVTANEDVHIISQVRDLENNVTKRLHTYKPSGAADFITSEDFPGGAALYTSGNDVFIIGLTSSKRIFIEKAEGGTNNFTRVYEATSGRTFDHGVVHIDNGKVYYYLMENKSGSAQPLYLQIIDLGIVPQDPLAANNFTIQAVGETCASKNNGKLIITGNATHDYATTINGVAYDFTKELTIEDLTPGTYDFCIDVVGKNYSHCYEVTIEGGVSMTGKIEIVKKSASVSVTSGTGPYKVYKNGVELFETHQTNFTIAVDHGDEIRVESKEACQGLMAKTINLLEDIKAYPNPTSGLFELYIPNTIEAIELEVYNIHSQLITSKVYTVQGGKVQLNLENKPKGIYFVKVKSEKPVFIKLIKK